MKQTSMGVHICTSEKHSNSHKSTLLNSSVCDSYWNNGLCNY